MTQSFRNLHTDKKIHFGVIEFSFIANPLAKFN